MAKSLNVGVLGFGHVGSSVVKIIDDGKFKNIKVTSIFDKPEKLHLIGPRFVDNAVNLITSSEIDVVVDALGSYDFSLQLIKTALKFHKHVVTTSKEVVAKNMEELTKLATDNNVSFLYEATVCGGTQVVYPLSLVAKCNDVSKIYGILSGSINYVLTRMHVDWIDYKKSLELAGENKFTEKNPKLDVNGTDSVQKITILSNLAFQTKINMSEVISRPISTINEDVINYTRNNDLVIKYVAGAYKKGKNITIFVEPFVFNKNHPFANVMEEENIVAIESEFNGKLVFQGLGAGGYPTGSAVVSDIWKLYEGIDGYDYVNNGTYNINKKYELKGDYLVKIKGEDAKIIDAKELKESLEDKKLQFYAKIWVDEIDA